MAVLPIVLNPDPVLRRKAKPVQKVNAAIRQLLDDMAETMYDAPGIGLAAPQVGVSKRVIVCDVQVKDGPGLLKLVNPEIIQKEGSITWNEGCLSIPGYVGDVERAARVKVTALNEYGHKVWIDAEGLLAVCLQHEIDHLDGVLYIDVAANIREVEPGERELGGQEAGAAGEGGEAGPAETVAEVSPAPGEAAAPDRQEG